MAGSDNGNIFMWQPEAILKSDESLIAKFDKHKGSVAALDFNPFQVSLTLMNLCVVSAATAHFYP